MDDALERLEKLKKDLEKNNLRAFGLIWYDLVRKRRVAKICKDLKELREIVDNE